MTDMRYMDHLDVVAADAVGLIRQKTETYGDSWKRRGGPGAWFTTVRPIDRLEGILTKWGGDIFGAIALHPSGEDGSALACVRDIMNYCILIEAHARAVLGVGPHGPARESMPVGPFGSGEADVYEEGGEHDGAAVFDEDGQPYCLIAADLCVGGKTGALARAVTIASILNRDFATRLPPPIRPGTPEDGGHHARHPLEEDMGATVCSVCQCGPGHAPDCPRAQGMDRAGEVTEDTQRAGGSAVATLAPSARLEGFEKAVRLLAEEWGIKISCTGGGDGLVQTIKVVRPSA